LEEAHPGADGVAETEAVADAAEGGASAETEGAEAGPSAEPVGEPEALEVAADADAGSREPAGDEPAEAAAADPGASPAVAEQEVFYTFTWVGRGRREENRRGGPPKGKGGARPKNKRPPRKEASQKTEARPPRKLDRVDPDNPFAAALMGLKDKL
jgi:ATP-dependent RNA helicase SUPV3L1/SUV3